MRHYTDQAYDHFVGQEGTCSLDQETRLLHAKLHTSGHLLSNVIESLGPCWKATKGHHFPGQCYVEFTSKNGHIDNVSLERIHQEIEKFIEVDSVTTVEQVSNQRFQELCPDMPYTLSSDQPIRVIRIGDFPFSPCGGTHVKRLKELKGLEISKYKIKNNMLKIYYHLNEDRGYGISAH